MGESMRVLGGEGSEVPELVRAVLRDDEVAYFDSECGLWFGVVDGDYSDWRNIRQLTTGWENAT